MLSSVLLASSGLLDSSPEGSFFPYCPFWPDAQWLRIHEKWPKLHFFSVIKFNKCYSIFIIWDLVDNKIAYFFKKKLHIWYLWGCSKLSQTIPLKNTENNEKYTQH